MPRYPTSNNLALWVALTRSYYYMRRIREKELKKIGLSVAQSTVLAIIDECEEQGTDATPVAISKRLLKAASTTTEILDRMVKKGLIIRINDLERKNMVRVHMTDMGREMFERSRQVRYFDSIFAKLTPAKRNSLKAYLNLLTDVAKKRLPVRK